MAKGVKAFCHGLAPGAIGLKTLNSPRCALEQVNTVISVGYDMAEYRSRSGNPTGDKTIVHIDGIPAQGDERHIAEVDPLGDSATSSKAIALEARPQAAAPFKAVRKVRVEGHAEFSRDDAFPTKP